MTFEPIDWPDEYEAAHDRQDDDDTPSPVARFKRYLAARKTTRLGHRDTDTDETERLAVSTYRPIVPNEQLVHDVAQKVAVRALHDSVNVDQWITAVVNSAFGDSNGNLEERMAYHAAVARRMAVVKPSWPAEQPQDDGGVRACVHCQRDLTRASVHTIQGIDVCADIRYCLARQSRFVERIADLNQLEVQRRAEQVGDVRAVAALLKLGDTSFRGNWLTDYDDARSELESLFADRIAALEARDTADGGAE